MKQRPPVHIRGHDRGAGADARRRRDLRGAGAPWYVASRFVMITVALGQIVWGVA